MNAHAGTWSGLVAGQQNVHHRGLHAAVLDANGDLIAITGPATSKKSKADAEMLAQLINKAAELHVHPSTLN